MGFDEMCAQLIPELNYLKDVEGGKEIIRRRLCSRFLEHGKFAGPETFPPGGWLEEVNEIRDAVKQLLKFQKDN